MPVGDLASVFRLAPLVSDADRVDVLYLPPGGTIGHQPAKARQLVAVLVGEGWAEGTASGPGEVRGRRQLRAGQAVLFAADEEHAAGTARGMTALSIEGAFEVGAFAVSTEIVVADYDPSWRTWFETLRAHLWPAVSDLALGVEHVGSTSVPGLAAKPIIDVDIVVAEEASLRPVIERLSSLGYTWRGDYGVTGREAFAPPDGAELPPHHLYLVVENNRAHVDHWLLREVLASDEVARRQYGELKAKNALEAEGDIDFYVAAKAAFVAGLLERARADRGMPPVTYWRPEAPRTP